VDRAQPHSSRRVAGFELLETLGRGSFGVVYRAHDPQLGRDVALKLVQLHSKRGLERFQREGEALARLRHAGVVTVHSAGILKDGTPYLSMELIEGGQTLDSILGDLSWAEGAALLLEVSRAVGFAHAQGVVHRDLKPANVLIDPQGRPRVADFGLALVEGQERLTLTGAILGTPATMAPEQLVGGRSEVGPGADVWSLGVMLYLVSCKRLPFPATSLPELAERLVNAKPRPPRELNATISAALEAVILRCLRSDPQARYADANALAQDLERALESRGPRALRWSPALGLVALVVTGALALVALSSETPSSPPPSLAPDAASVDSAARPTTLEELLHESQHATQDLGDATAGLRAAERALLLAPSSARALDLRSQALFSLDRLRPALADLERALELAPSVRGSYLRRGHVLQTLGESVRARDDYRRALSFPAEDAEGHAERGEAHMRLGELRRAKTALERARQLDASLMSPHYHLGRLAARDLRYDVCVRHYERVVALTPQRPQSYSDLGTAQWQLGDHAGALKSCARALELNPHELLALATRGGLRRSLGKLRGARADYDLLLSLLPNDLELRMRRGAVLMHLGAHEAAERDLTLALGLRHSQFDLRARRAVVRLAQGNLGGAVEDLKASLELARPLGLSEKWRTQLERTLEQTQTLASLGQSGSARLAAPLSEALGRSAIAAAANRLVSVGRRLESAKAMERACTTALLVSPKYPPAHIALGDALQGQKKYAAALRAFERAASLDEADAAPHVRIGTLHFSRSHLRKAIAAYSRALSRDPRRVVAYANRAVSHAKLGEAAEALADAKRAIEIAPQRAPAWVAHSEVLILSDDRSGALESVERALRLDADNVPALCNRAHLRILAGDVSAARVDVERALRTNSRYAEAHRLQGDALRLGSKPQEAAKAYERALELANPASRVARRVRAGLEQLAQER
jgi:serine/threonine protein kinase/Tfp pilus assembly protein PilF